MRSSSPAQAIRAITNLLSVEAQRKHLDLTLHVAPDVPARLVGDPVRLRQVLSNLVGNAVKFTNQGGVTVTVRRETDTGAESHGEVVLRFDISDTGIGIAENMMGRLFQPFSQLDDSSSRKYGGTGLGLAISARLVKLMGGQIELESEIGRGSTFHFTTRFAEPNPSAIG